MNGVSSPLVRSVIKRANLLNAILQNVMFSPMFTLGTFGKIA